MPLCRFHYSHFWEVALSSWVPLSLAGQARFRPLHRLHCLQREQRLSLDHALVSEPLEARPLESRRALTESVSTPQYSSSLSHSLLRPLTGSLLPGAGAAAGVGPPPPVFFLGGMMMIRRFNARQTSAGSTQAIGRPEFTFLTTKALLCSPALKVLVVPHTDAALSIPKAHGRPAATKRRSCPKP